MPVATETFKEEISPLIGIDKTLSEFSKILFETPSCSEPTTNAMGN